METAKIRMTHSRPTDNTVFQASFSDFRLVKGRKVCQLIFEVPIEQADIALAVLGGIPNPEHSVWVGIARINLNQKPVLKPTDIWRASSECAMLCKEKSFQSFLRSASEEQATIKVRHYCEVDSRRELDRNEAAVHRWRRLKADYERWKQRLEQWKRDGDGENP